MKDRVYSRDLSSFDRTSIEMPILLWPLASNIRYSVLCIIIYVCIIASHWVNIEVHTTYVLHTPYSVCSINTLCCRSQSYCMLVPCSIVYNTTPGGVFCNKSHFKKGLNGISVDRRRSVCGSVLSKEEKKRHVTKCQIKVRAAPHSVRASRLARAQGCSPQQWMGLAHCLCPMTIPQRATPHHNFAERGSRNSPPSLPGPAAAAQATSRRRITAPCLAAARAYFGHLWSPSYLEPLAAVLNVVPVYLEGRSTQHTYSV